MLRILITASVLFWYAVTCSALPKKMYGYIGGGIGPQSISYTAQEKQLISELLSDKAKVKIKEMTMNSFLAEIKYQNISDEGKKENKEILTTILDEQIKFKEQYISSLWNEWNRMVVTLMTSIRIGLGYHLQDWISIEAGYNAFHSRIINRDLQHIDTVARQFVHDVDLHYFDQSNKPFFTQGIQIIGKGRMSLNERWCLFGQLGTALYIGVADLIQPRFITSEKAIFENGAFAGLQIQTNQSFPPSPAFITGGGLQYTLSSQRVLEISWTHMRIRALQPINLLAVNLILL